MMTNAQSSNRRVNVHTEWDPLEEIIVGRADFAQIPEDLGITALSRSASDVYDQMKPRRFGDRIIEETNEDLEALVHQLEALGVTVKRPEPFDFAGRVQTPLWSSGYYFPYCPRDILLAIGDTVIETPNVFRSRYFEPWAYKHILTEYLREGARWFSAPRPMLRDETYSLTPGDGLAVDESEPLFDAANVIRAGRDLFYLVSDSGNEMGLRWLESIFGSEYRIHACRGLYSSAHIDTTLVFLRPGLVLANPERVTRENLPAPLRSWDVIHAPPMQTPKYSDEPPMASKWFGMNLLMVNPSLAIVDGHQDELRRELGKVGVETIPMVLRHGRALGGGFHCVTLDVRRRGQLESYFDAE